MLGPLAPRLILTPLTAAPPHFAIVVILMGSTRPVEVLLLRKFLAAAPAHLDAIVDLAFPTLKLGYPQLHFIALINHDLYLLFELQLVVNLVLQRFLQLFDLG